MAGKTKPKSVGEQGKLPGKSKPKSVGEQGELAGKSVAAGDALLRRSEWRGRALELRCGEMASREADPTGRLRQSDGENTTRWKRVAPRQGEAHLGYNRTEEGGSGKQGRGGGGEVAWSRPPKWRGGCE